MNLSFHYVTNYLELDALSPLATHSLGSLFSEGYESGSLSFYKLFFMNFLGPERTTVAIALDGDQVVGMMAMNPFADNKGFVLKDLKVLLEYRRRGIAFKLATLILEKACSEVTTERIELQCAKDNTAAANLYHSLGFRVYTTLDNIRCYRLSLPSKASDIPSLT